MSISPLAKNLSAIHAKIFSGLIERAQLQVKLALGERLDKDLAALEDKYDGREANALEEQVNALFDRKDALARKFAALKDSLKIINDVRESFNTMSDHADGSFGPSFDLEADALNSTVGSAVLNEDKLIGNPGTGLSAKSEVIAMGTTTTTIQRAFLGTDYYITLNDGTVMSPDHGDRTLAGISFDSLTLNSLVGDTIQFSDGVTTYDGTLTRTGSGILSAWLYNNFTAQADIDEAKADIADAMKRADTTDDAFRRNVALIESGISQLDSEMQSAAGAFKLQTAEDLSAKQAERKALTTRFDLSMNTLSLSAGISSALILSLFAAPDPNEKQSVFDVLTGPIG